MNICTGSSGWASFFSFCEVIFTSVLLVIYLRYMLKIVKNKEVSNYEKLDVLVILLSIIQIVLYIIYFIFKEYYFISLLVTILKFSENAIICCLLLVIILWKYSSITYLIMNYFIISIVIAAIAFFVFGLIEHHPFETNYCKPKIECILSFLGLLFNIVVLCCSFYFSSMEREEAQLKNQLMQGQDDQYYINNMFNKYVDNIKKMMKSYLIITILFLISFSIDIIFNVLKQKVVTITTDETTKVETPTCNYYGNFEDQFGIRQYFLCCIAFIIRDLSPHIYIFFAIFFLQPESISRSSSFIEAL